MPRLAYKIYLAANAGLGKIESLLNSNESIHPPIFIVGPPRSGSTLFYQVLASSSSFAYLSNAHCRLYGAPWVIEKFRSYREHFAADANFESKFGSTDKWFEPSECGNYWYRFFRRKPKFCGNDDVTLNQMSALEHSINLLQSISNKPFLSKNLMNTFRLQPLSSRFPNAIYLVIRRQIVPNAHSILEARFRLNGNYQEWFSTEPINVSSLKSLSPEAQVVEQIHASYKAIKEIASLKPDNVFEMEYETFCESPNQTLNDLKSFFESHNIEFDIPKLPKKFNLRDEIRIDKNLYAKLLEYVNQNNLTLT